MMKKNLAQSYPYTDVLYSVQKKKNKEKLLSGDGSPEQWNRLMRNVYVITIRNDRYRRFMDQFNEKKKESGTVASRYRGLTICKVEGIDGNHLDKAKLQQDGKYEPIDEYNEMTRGQIGCFLSHRKVWELIASSEKEEEEGVGFVCEDDCDLRWNPEIAQFINQAISQVNFIWDVLYLGRFPSFSRSLGRIRPNIVKTGKTWGLHAYLLTRKAASELLEASVPFSVPVDVFVSTAENAAKRRIGISPIPIGIREGETSDTKNIL